MYVKNTRRLNDALLKGPEQAKAGKAKAGLLVESIVYGLCEKDARARLCEISGKTEKNDTQKDKDKNGDKKRDEKGEKDLPVPDKWWWPPGC